MLSPGETASASVAFVSGATKHAVDASYLVVTPPNAYDHLVIGPFFRSMAIPIYRGNLYVTAMARHTRTPNLTPATTNPGKPERRFQAPRTGARACRRQLEPLINSSH